MKKSLFFIPAALVALASCSNEDFDGATGNNGYNGETETRYLTVNIIDNVSGTRADAVYEDGTEAENEVTYVRFYLFGQQGSDFQNTYKDCTAEAVANSAVAPNVEKKLQSVIVFEAPINSVEPIEIVAVVNPPAELDKEKVFDTPAELQDEIGNYNAATKGNFILTNSVYVDGNEQHIGYEVKESYPTREEALGNPVEIYVERVVAKARVEVEMTANGNGHYKINTKLDAAAPENANTFKVKVYDNEGNFVEKDIYLNLLGWNVTGTAKETRLVKKVNPDWTNVSGLTNWGWNDVAKFRSYWAENTTNLQSVTADNYQTGLNFGRFSTGSAAADYITKFTGDNGAVNYTYLLENAGNTAGKSPAYATKLIVAAQLVDADGKGVDLAWWKGNYYLKSNLLQVLATESRVYSLKDGVYEPLSASDIEFVNSQGQSNAKRRYFSMAKLKGDLTGDWYEKDGTGKYKKIEGAATTRVNDILRDLDVVKVWSNGYTYYWTDITHLGNAPTETNADNYGYTGIVRNHIYDYELSAFVGLGIPVLNPGDPTTTPDDPNNPDPDPDPENPDDTIYPEDPEDPEYAFIAARINVLSWRFVGHTNTQLGWE